MCAYAGVLRRDGMGSDWHQLARLERDDLRRPRELRGADQHVVRGAEPRHPVEAHERCKPNKPVRRKLIQGVQHADADCDELPYIEIAPATGFQAVRPTAVGGRLKSGCAGGGGAGVRGASSSH